MKWLEIHKNSKRTCVRNLSGCKVCNRHLAGGGSVITLNLRSAKCVATAFILICFGCDAKAMEYGLNGAIEVRGKTIVITGGISEDMPSKFKHLLRKQDIETVVLDSNGGVEAAAILIAKEIRKRKLAIVVDGLCLSSCANFLFPAGVSKSVTENSIVGWHSGDFHWYLYYLVKNDRRMQWEMRKSIREGKIFYDKIGADYSIIIDAGRAVNLISPEVLATQTDGNEGLRYLGWQSEFDFWIPSPSVIERYGIRLSKDEFWYSDDPSELASILSDRLGADIRVTTAPAESANK